MASDHWRPLYDLVAGLLCHVDDACISNPCREGAQCDTNPINGKFNCNCPPGYVGSTCRDDVNECIMGKSRSALDMPQSTLSSSVPQDGGKRQGRGFWPSQEMQEHNGFITAFYFVAVSWLRLSQCFSLAKIHFVILKLPSQNFTWSTIPT